MIAMITRTRMSIWEKIMLITYPVMAILIMLTVLPTLGHSYTYNVWVGILCILAAVICVIATRTAMSSGMRPSDTGYGGGLLFGLLGIILLAQTFGFPILRIGFN